MHDNVLPHLCQLKGDTEIYSTFHELCQTISSAHRYEIVLERRV